MYSLDELDLYRGRYGPAWRFRLAHELAESAGPPPIRDPLCRDMTRFLWLLSEGGINRCTAVRAFPQIAQARAIQADERLADSLRIMLLGGLAEAEILERSGLTNKEFRLWRSIFCELRPTDSVSWRMRKMVWTEVDAGHLGRAGKFHVAMVGGPMIARQLLDGPGQVPLDGQAQARYVRQQAIMACSGLFLAGGPSPEMERLHHLVLQSLKAEQQHRHAEQRLADRRARDELRQEYSKRRLRLANLQVEKKAAAAAARAQKKIDEERLREWQYEQLAAQEQRERAALLARIAASPLSQVPWAPSKKIHPAADQELAAVPSPSPLHSASTSGKRSPCTKPRAQQLTKRKEKAPPPQDSANRRNSSIRPPAAIPSS